MQIIGYVLEAEKALTSYTSLFGIRSSRESEQQPSALGIDTVQQLVDEL
jgi:hypothetical protein